MENLKETYVELRVQTPTGWKSKLFYFQEDWVFGKFLCHYYKGKNYNWAELDSETVKILKEYHKKEFKFIG